MDRCPNCGNKINSLDVLCPRCGSVVEVVHTGPAQTAAEPTKSPPKPEFPPHLVVYNEDPPEHLKHNEELPVSENKEAAEPESGSPPALSEEALLLLRIREIEKRFESEEVSEDTSEASSPSYKEQEEETVNDENLSEPGDDTVRFGPKLSELLKERPEEGAGNTEPDDTSERIGPTLSELLKKRQEEFDGDNEPDEQAVGKGSALTELHGDESNGYEFSSGENLPYYVNTDSGKSEAVPEPEKSEDFKKAYADENSLRHEENNNCPKKSDDFSGTPFFHPKKSDDFSGTPYSKRYIDNITGAALPDIDKINGFDPEDFMRRYKLNRRLYGYNAINEGKAETKENPEHQRFSAEFSEPQAQPVMSAQNDADSSDKTQYTERRYRAKDESDALNGFTFVERRYGHTPPAENAEQAPELQRRYRGDEKKTERPEKIEPKKQREIKIAVKSQGKLPTVFSILIWAVVAAALFAGFMFFDNYVKTSYGNYGSFIYSITDGKIDLDSAPEPTS